MHRQGIVDLGSNTARLVVYSFEPGSWYRLEDQIRCPIRLGEGLGRDGRLTPEAMSRAAAALRLFRDYAAATDLPPLEILGTSAVRDAANSAELLELATSLGLSVQVVDGATEAGLGVLAVANGFDFEDAWVFDLGGGSAQLSAMRRRRSAGGSAYPLGSVRLTERYLDNDPPTAVEVEALEAGVEAELGEEVATMRSDRAPLVAMGGTVRNLARAVQKADRYPLIDRLHGYRLERDRLEELVERLLTADTRGRLRIRGIQRDRADVILAGALVYRWLLRESGRDHLLISGHGLREGALFRHFLPSPHLWEDLRSASVDNLISHYAQSKSHVDRVGLLAARLFAGLAPLHGLGEREAELLEAAVRLQDIGLAVNYYRHDRHGAYLVSSAALAGYSHREQALLALVVRYHLKGTPSLGGFSRLCREGDREILRALVVCLRLADHLDRPRSGRVRDLSVAIEPRVVRLLLETHEDPSVELWDIERHAALFRRAFGRRLVIGRAK